MKNISYAVLSEKLTPPFLRYMIKGLECRIAAAGYGRVSANFVL